MKLEINQDKSILVPPNLIIEKFFHHAVKTSRFDKLYIREIKFSIIVSRKREKILKHRMQNSIVQDIVNSATGIVDRL